MILHIVHDDKFADMAYRAFENARPGANEFVVLGLEKPLKYIRTAPIRFVNFLQLHTGAFAKTLKGYDLVVLHWLDGDKIRLLRQADKSVKFVWIGWGADYYDLICRTEELLKPLTLNEVKGSGREREHISGRIKKVLKSILGREKDRKSVMSRINFFSAPLYEDYRMIKECYPGFTPVYVPWNYGSLEDDLVRGFEGVSASGNDILVGNSATATNNHFDIFEAVKRLDLKGRKIICPLNYGDADYGKRVIARGEELFPGEFIPIREHMQLPDYLKTLTSCSIAVMGHIRQQAGGNIIMLLHLGTKVFLDPRNPWYAFFKNEGAAIFSLDELEREAGSRLGGEQVEHNRAILRKHWGREAIRRKTVDLIAVVSGDGGSK